MRGATRKKIACHTSLSRASSTLVPSSHQHAPIPTLIAEKVLLLLMWLNIKKFSHSVWRASFTSNASVSCTPDGCSHSHRCHNCSLAPMNLHDSTFFSNIPEYTTYPHNSLTTSEIHHAPLHSVCSVSSLLLFLESVCKLWPRLLHVDFFMFRSVVLPLLVSIPPCVQLDHISVSSMVLCFDRFSRDLIGHRFSKGSVTSR